MAVFATALAVAFIPLAVALAVPAAAFEVALPAASSALSAPLTAELVSMVTVFSVVTVLLSTVVAVFFWHPARPSARTRAVRAIFFMIVPFLIGAGSPAEAQPAVFIGQASARPYSAVPHHAIVICCGALNRGRSTSAARPGSGE